MATIIFQTSFAYCLVVSSFKVSNDSDNICHDMYIIVQATGNNQFLVQKIHTNLYEFARIHMNFIHKFVYEVHEKFLHEFAHEFIHEKRFRARIHARILHF